MLHETNGYDRSDMCLYLEMNIMLFISTMLMRKMMCNFVVCFVILREIGTSQIVTKNKDREGTLKSSHIIFISNHLTTICTTILLSQDKWM